MTLLSTDKIERFLRNSKDWIFSENSIKKLYTFESYMDSIDFINMLAKKAESNNHHPDMNIGWCKINLSFTSHDKGGVTIQCLEMANQADIIYKNLKLPKIN